MSIKVSVIIPVYNAEKYIVSCMESLLDQTLKECEFIFINDGSMDKSKQMIDKYRRIDNRIKLINQGNQGVSMARNKGMSIANGEYIGFVDADDYVEKDMFEMLYNSAKQSECDIVISNFESELDGRKVMIKYPFPMESILEKEYIGKELLPYFLKADNLNTACNKIYKRKIITENNIRFPEKVALGEDGLFNIRYFSQATTAKYIDYTGYHYREVAGSATRNISEKDYFNRALEVYTSELPDLNLDNLNQVKIRQLKSIKLINSVMSYIHIYFTPTRKVNFGKRYQYVKNMISNKYVRESLPIYYEQNYSNLGKYERLILDLIKRKSAWGLYCVSTYSRLRNG